MKRAKLEQSEYEPCVYLSNDGDVRACVHVDDLMLFAKSEEKLHQICEHLKQSYGELKVQKGPIVNYLGQTFDFSSASAVQISMRNYVDELLEGIEVASAATPASNDLFNIELGSELLTVQEKDKFHSTVARLLYLSNRVRPDLSTAVAFLCTRVSNPTVNDKTKLTRLLNYLQRTKLIGLTLTADPQKKLLAYVDASFATHPDRKGHTGGFLTLGGGAFLTKSIKQRLVTTSSCESELVAQSDFLSEALHVRNFLMSIDFHVGPIILHQDNLSAIHLAESGKPGKRSKHVDIKFFFVTDRIRNGEVSLKYQPTDLMYADLLTKPLQGAKFRKFRSIILHDNKD